MNRASVRSAAGVLKPAMSVRLFFPQSVGRAWRGTGVTNPPAGMPAIYGETIMIKTMMLAGAMLAAVTGASFAHATLEKGEAALGSTYKAVYRVPHGCEGKPTTTVRVQIPEGFIAVKPMPKAGWKLEKVRGAYAKSYDYHGTPMTEGVKEVIWSGGSLPDDEYEEFILRGTLAGDFKVGEMLYFPIIQECPEGAAERWIETPAAGQSGDDLEMPAPGIKILEKSGGH